MGGNKGDSIWPKFLICAVLLLAVSVFALVVVLYDQGVAFNERATQNQVMLCRLLPAHGQGYPAACDRYDSSRIR